MKAFFSETAQTKTVRFRKVPLKSELKEIETIKHLI